METHTHEASTFTEEQCSLVCIVKRPDRQATGHLVCPRCKYPLNLAINMPIESITYADKPQNETQWCLIDSGTWDTGPSAT